MSVPVAMIAAVARNGVIGNHGAIPWRLPTDFAHFRRTTMGKPVLMGRKTFESIGKPLDGRVNIVMSRQPGYQPDGVIVVNDLDAALGHAQAMATADGASEVMILGGETIYRQAMPRADRLYITHVELAPEGDARFPEIEPDIWSGEEDCAVVPGSRDSAGFRVFTYVRGSAAAR
jgi:dihydrofolate reductase